MGLLAKKVPRLSVVTKGWNRLSWNLDPKGTSSLCEVGYYMGDRAVHLLSLTSCVTLRMPPNFSVSSSTRRDDSGSWLSVPGLRPP